MLRPLCSKFLGPAFFSTAYIALASLLPDEYPLIPYQVENKSATETLSDAELFVQISEAAG